MTRTLHIATRRSPLALWQAEHVADRLRGQLPGHAVKLVPMSTIGDRVLDSPLAKIGGKGLFVKELEQALVDGRADLAVHSMKDVPAELPDGLVISCILEREDPCDAFVSSKYADIDELPAGARVGTSSLRRRAQISAMRPDLEIFDLRGNVGTRLQKLDDGEFDAILLACAGLERLGLADRVRARIDARRMLPAIGQGAIGIECRADDAELRGWLAPLADADTTACVTAERAMNARLNGGCQVPIAGHATLSAGQLSLHGLVASVDGKQTVRSTRAGAVQSAAVIGEAVAADLLARGAGPLLAAVGISPD
ncbi:MAG: hydroxymethylbilane synthase [Chromatiales bacterium]|nr:hydroxymethylbilane synthase [Chromatiales bacterium]